MSEMDLPDLRNAGTGHLRWLDRDALVSRLQWAQADPGLRADLAEIAGDTTDDLGPIA